MSYDHASIEGKWQKRWEDEEIFQAKDGGKKEKFYALVEFPYPSGAGLHVGHPRSYTAIDVVARKKRMEGKNVLFPMGWDAFGLPAENYALKTGIAPAISTKQNIDTFRRQLKSLGFSFDWSREFSTTDPEYYKWTQWMFLQFFKAGLAYKAKTVINWCPKDKIGLANEEVVGGACERCGTPVEKREKEQWMIAITKYADRLLEDLKTVDYLPKIKKQQEDWIGKSEGALIRFDQVEVFTTRPDTIFGATFLVLAPEHPLVAELTTKEQKKAVEKYLASAKKKTDIERGDESKEKTGVFLGSYVTNPASGEKIPVWVADYVLTGYGTGAIMAVPAHDERDFAFAARYDLLVRHVIMPSVFDLKNPPREGKENTKRNIILGIVRNPKTGKFLCLKWKKQPWTTFITGGIEGDEDPVEAARREITEETGYSDLKFVRLLGGPTESFFFAAHKDLNRQVHNQTVFFELQSDARTALSKDEQEQYDTVWLSPDEVVAAHLQHAEFDLVWDRIMTGIDAYSGDGVLINSGVLNGQKAGEVKDQIIDLVHGQKVTKYKLRDWVFSRQRYWGEPIPLVHCPKDGWVAVPDKELPVKLPEVEKYEPTDTGESPLANISDWVNTTCPNCDGPAKRETDTMPNWAGSSWYFLRYIDAHNDKAFADKKKLKYWLPVDLYNGGMEHTTLHLLYSRFWHKFLYDQKLVPTPEPYARRHSHGLILAEDGTKMSKSKGNVVNPDDIVKEFGADALRTYILFMGPFEEPVPWSTNGLVGVRRFLEKVTRLAEKVAKTEPLAVTKALHKVIAKVSDDIEAFRFNTAVSEMMKFVNTVGESAITKKSFETFLTVLNPFAPHLTDELAGEVLDTAAWPKADPKLLIDDEMTIVVQVNGKVRANIIVPAGTSDKDLLAAAKSEASVAKYLTSTPKKEIVVKGKLVNFVV